MPSTKKNDAYARWLIEQANRKEKEEISCSLGRLKITLFNVVVIGLLSAILILAIRRQLVLPTGANYSGRIH
ncbi:hypothetical protein [Enterobacter asburiae]